MSVIYKNRRMFIRGAGGFVFAIPFLPSLLAPTYARAQTDKNRELDYFISHFIPNGIMDTFWPNHLPYQALPEAREHPFALNENGLISPSFPASINPYMDKMLLLQGLDLTGLPYQSHHFYNHHSNGRPHASTLDVVIRNGIYGALEPRKMDLLPLFSTRQQQKAHDGFSKDDSKNVPYEKNPYTVYLKHFKGIIDPQNRDQPENSEASQANANNLREKRIMDIVHGNAKALLDHKRISKADKERLQLYLEQINKLEATAMQIAADVQFAAFHPIDIERGVLQIDHKDQLNFNAQLAAAAIMSGSTRVVSHHMIDKDEPIAHDLARLLNQPGQFHNAVSHNNSIGGRQDMGTCWNYIMDNGLSPLLELLSKPIHTESNQTFLDRTLIMLGSENGYGHTGLGLPIVLFSGNKNVIRGGRMIDYTDYSQPWGSATAKMKSKETGELIFQVHHGRPLLQLYSHIFEAFGLPKDAGKKADIPWTGGKHYKDYTEDGDVVGKLPYLV